MSCCQCLKIQVLTDVVGLPARFKQDDRVYLDLPREFTLELSKTISELSILDTIATDAAIEFSVPYTPKNDIITKFVRNHNQIGNDYAPLQILVQEGSVNQHAFRELLFTGSSDAGREYSAKLQRGVTHWLDGAAAKYLNTVNFGTFEFTAANLIDNWTNDATYNDGDAGVYFPLVHYGGWYALNTMLVEDFRPWFHALSVLQKGFCEIGWSFRCPWLETVVGRKLGSYILDSGYGTDMLALENARFYAEKDGTATGGNLHFPTVILNTGGFYNPGTLSSSFTGIGVFNFTAVVQVDVQFFPTFTTGTGTLQIIKLNEDFTEEIVGTGTGTATDTSPSVLITVEAKNVSVLSGQYIFVRLIQTTTEGLWLDREGFFKNEPVRVPPQNGDILTLKNFIHPDYTLLGFLKGIVHPCNGKFKTDWVTKTLWLYTPYDREWYNEGVEGFYTNVVENITELIVKDSEEIVIEKTAQARHVTLQFKDSSDSYIDKFKLEQDAPLYSKKIDLGADFLNAEEINANPFFEPTVNAVIDKFAVISPLTTPVQNVDLPHLWDNEAGEISYKIAPRLLYFEGWVTQLYDNDSSAVRYWRFENSIQTLLPWAYQLTTIGFAKDVANDVFLPRKEIVYGENDNDFYNLGYARELMSLKFANRSGLFMLIGSQRYRNEDFRKLFEIFYNGRTFLARMLEINAYQTCAAAPAQVVIRAEPFVGDVCADNITVDPDACPNQPRIDVFYDFDLDEISALADDTGISSTIASDDWEFSSDDGATFSFYSPGTDLSGFGSVIFRRIVSFTDGCPTKVVTRIADFSSQCENNPGITLDYNEGTNTITAVGSGVFNSSINTDTFEVNIDNVGYVSYTEGVEISGFDEITFRRTVNYTNSCPETIVTATYTVTGEPCSNMPVITFTEALSGTCVYHLGLTGITSTVSFVSYQISDNNGTTWRHHDGSPIRRTDTTRVRAYIYYSDDCPTDVVEQICP